MDTFTLVRPEHLNHHGYLFGGVMLKWVDENAWMAATREYPNSTLVTVGMDACRFKHPVDNGSILHFHIREVKRGHSSVTYTVQVFPKGLIRAERGRSSARPSALFISTSAVGHASCPSR